MTNYPYVITSSTRTLIVNEFNITAITSTGLEIDVKLSRNSSNVVKINKSAISVTTPGMLAELLRLDTMAFDTVYNHVARYTNDGGYCVSTAYFYNLFNDDLNELERFFNNSDSTTRSIVIRDHMCDNHTAKMAGMCSYSTSVELNIFCNCRMKKDCAVCKHCFAYRQLGIYHDQRKKLKRAHIIATKCEWNTIDIPYINPEKFPYFRLESFGDINNTLQVRNYNTLAYVLGVCYGIKTTLWTKNPGIIQQAINEGMQLTKALVIGLSSLELNKPETEKAKKYKFIKFVFTVFEHEYAKQHNVKINCGGRRCRSCLNCYLKAAKLAPGEIIEINELLK